MFNDRWYDYVPMKFHRVSGMRSHAFAVDLPNWRPTNGSPTPQGNSFRLRCQLGGIARLVDVSPASEASVFAALVLLCSVTGETERERRFIVVASAYETLVSDRDVDAMSIRHALAHSPMALRSPGVLASLQRRFGSVHIDLSQHDHRKPFFVSLGGMLVAIDKAIASRLAFVA